MESLRRRLAGSRASAWVLVAVAVRALVPDGFMVGTAPDGGATIVFCHGAGLAMPAPAAGGHHNHAVRQQDAPQHTGHAHHSGHVQHEAQGAADSAPAGEGGHHAQPGQCAFAASSVLAPPPLFAAPPALFLAGTRAPAETPAVALPQERARRPGARAPPAFS